MMNQGRTKGSRGRKKGRSKGRKKGRTTTHNRGGGVGQPHTHVQWGVGQPHTNTWVCMRMELVEVSIARKTSLCVEFVLCGRLVEHGALTLLHGRLDCVEDWGTL